MVAPRDVAPIWYLHFFKIRSFVARDLLIGAWRRRRQHGHRHGPRPFGLVWFGLVGFSFDASLGPNEGPEFVYSTQSSFIFVPRMSQIVHKLYPQIHKWMPRDPVSETSESGEFAYAAFALGDLRWNALPTAWSEEGTAGWSRNLFKIPGTKSNIFLLSTRLLRAACSSELSLSQEESVNNEVCVHPQG